MIITLGIPEQQLELSKREARILETILRGFDVRFNELSYTGGSYYETALLTEVGLSVRCLNCLKMACEEEEISFKTLRLTDIPKHWSKRELSKCRNFGSKSLKELGEVLFNAGILWE